MAWGSEKPADCLQYRQNKFQNAAALHVSVGRCIICHSTLAFILKPKTTFHVISMLYSIFFKNAGVSLEKISGLFSLGWINEVGLSSVRPATCMKERGNTRQEGNIKVDLK